MRIRMGRRLGDKEEKTERRKAEQEEKVERTKMLMVS